ncbi:Citrate lyase beta subunit [Nonomuraea solani]|uniref:Citrate lyase beta subunit n=1 Tax=Nonomuraea solani TaxID=1144553 RepID=A0A1H5TF01_9ACTN|nr:aldolase [Nonomuraea solani]SEF61320.1 Citrate lyase beta subunit [Nonomuraea solani]
MPAVPEGFAAAYRVQQARYPAADPAWQPVHTVYVPADRFSAGTVAEWGGQASSLVKAHLPGSDALAEVFGVPAGLAGAVHERVLRKLATEPVEDVRIDFEDGYGVRPGAEEDAHADAAVAAVVAMRAAGTLPRRWGPRVKSFADGDPERSVRTLERFVTGIVEGAGELPAGFTVTFPKVLMEAYLGQFAQVLERLEAGTRLRFEMQVEAPQTLAFLRGDLNEGLGGRLAAAHFGVFDYTAALGLPPHEQRLDHPACDHARHVMQTAFAGTGVELSDGSLAASPASDQAGDVHDLWRRHAALVEHSLRHGYYQGWDMHPSHLVSRYVTVYAFHLARYDSYRERVRAWEERRAAGGGVMDEPATIRTLTAALRRADLALP